MNKYKIIFTVFIFLFVLGFYIAMTNVLYGVLGCITLVLFLALGILISYGCVSLWKKLRKKEIPHTGTFYQKYFFVDAILIVVFSLLFWGTFYYTNNVNPVNLKQYTLSNGNRTVIFQSMVHIGKEDFYESVKSELTQAKKDGYVYFYEGVKPGSPENMKKFIKALGTNIDPDTYKSMGKLYGLTHQKPLMFLGLENELDFNVDVNIDQIMEDYHESEKEKNEPQTVIDIGKSLKQLDKIFSNFGMNVIQYINKATLNIIFGNEELLSLLMSQQNQALFDAILDKRNIIVAQEIQSSEYKKIYVTYGALHFEGIFKLLKEKDPNWKIISEKDFYPITKKTW